MTTNTKHLSIVDDDESVREALAGLMVAVGYAVDVFPTAADFLASPSINDTSCLIADVHLPGMTGVELHSRLLALGHVIPTILITAYPDDAIRTRALANGVFSYQSKPLDEGAFLGSIRAALERG